MAWGVYELSSTYHRSPCWLHAAPQTISSLRSDASSALSGMRTAVDDVQQDVLDRMDSLQAEWQPKLDKLDVV